jgi:AAA domain/Nuclease-related domain
VATRSTRTAGGTDEGATAEVAHGLFGIAGASAAQVATEAAAEQRELAAALRRSYRRQRNFEAAALSEPLTEAVLQPLSDQGWRVLHDRRWPGSKRANVDHLVIWYGGVAVLDTKHWSQPVQVRGGRLWCGDEDRHDDTVDNILRLTAAVEELLEEVSTSDPGRTLGLSPLHVVPVLVFTEHTRANQLAPQVGRVLLSTVDHLPARLSHRHRYLDDAQVGLIAEYLSREMPPALIEVPAERTPRPTPAVPVRPRPAPAPVPEPPSDADQLFDVAEVASHLQRALTQPIRDWMGFLHPAQAKLVRRTFNGPARVRGPAGTGKTVVLLHRAAWLATVRTGPILVTSFVRTLPPQLGSVYRALSPDTADRVEFTGVHALARRLLARNGQQLPVNQRRVDRAFNRAWQKAGRHTPLATLEDARYWREEIDHVIKGRGLRELADYEAIGREGRNRSLNNAQKYTVWTLLQAYQDELDREGTYDWNDVMSAALDSVNRTPPSPGWSAVLVDEVQDLSLLGLRLCRALAGDGTDTLFLVGDGQQALYPGGFTLADAGISVTGRAVVLRTNYRNTRQILDSARDLVAERAFTDLDNTPEPGRQEVEILRDGPPVRHVHAPHRRGLILQLRLAMRHDTTRGTRPGDMAILCHTRADVGFLTSALTAHDVTLTPLDSWSGEPDNNVKIGTINRAKGLDFAAVYLPHLSTAGSTNADQEDRYIQREYVARTRPRDHLWIGHIRPPTTTTYENPSGRRTAGGAHPEAPD